MQPPSSGSGAPSTPVTEGGSLGPRSCPTHLRLVLREGAPRGRHWSPRPHLVIPNSTFFRIIFFFLFWWWGAIEKERKKLAQQVNN